MLELAPARLVGCAVGGPVAVAPGAHAIADELPRAQERAEALPLLLGSAPDRVDQILVALDADARDPVLAREARIELDQALAWAAWAQQIPFAAIIPCAGQESRWPREAQGRYRELRSYASWEIVLASAYSSSCMQYRNCWMVDHATHVLALWNGGYEGGTANCVRYAQQVGRPWRNCWDRWRSLYEPAIEGLDDYTDDDIPF